MVPISQIPDLCILAIFKGIPLTNLISSLSCVCQNWTRLQPAELGKRKRLVLVCSPDGDFDSIIDSVQKIENPFKNRLVDYVKDDEGKPWAPLMPRSDIEFNLIRVPKVNRVCTLTEQFTTSLMAKLNGITHLTVVITLDCSFVDQNNASMRQLARIIDHNAASLISLKVHLDGSKSWSINDNEMEIDAQVLFDSINRIKQQLKHVSLNAQFPSERLSNRSFAFLARVQSFTSNKFSVVPIWVRIRPQFLLLSLNPHAAGGTCNPIDIGKPFELKKLIKLNHQLFDKFRRLAVLVAPGDEEDEGEDEAESEIRAPDPSGPKRVSMRIFGEKFVSLSSLELYNIRFPITKIARYLHRMTGLVTLKIRSMFNVEHHFESEDELVITQLPSVRMLSYNVCGPNHSDIKKMHLGELFPKLQVLEFKPGNVGCGECATERPLIGENVRSGLKITWKCARLTLQSLPSLIPSLRHVRYSPAVFDGDEQLLPVGFYDLEKLTQLIDVSEKYDL